MIRIVVPYAGSRGKTRLGARRAELSAAMLGDVLTVATSVGETWVVSPEPVEGATWIPDPGGGQGAAVSAALRHRSTTSASNRGTGTYTVCTGPGPGGPGYSAV